MYREETLYSIHGLIRSIETVYHFNCCWCSPVCLCFKTKIFKASSCFFTSSSYYFSYFYFILVDAFGTSGLLWILLHFSLCSVCFFSLHVFLRLKEQKQQQNDRKKHTIYILLRNECEKCRKRSVINVILDCFCCCFFFVLSFLSRSLPIIRLLKTNDKRDVKKMYPYKIWWVGMRNNRT